MIGGTVEEAPKIAWETTTVVEKAVATKAAPVEAPADVKRGKTVVVGAAGKDSGSGKKSSPKGKDAASPEKSLELEIVQEAAFSQQPVVLFFHMTGERLGERACQTMEKLVFGQKAIVELAAGFHTVKVDVNGLPAEILRQYQVKKAPTVVLLDHKGNVASTLVGKTTPQRLLSSMKAVEARNKELVRQAELASTTK